MRQIKFRACDKKNNIMLYDSEGDYPFIADEEYIKIKHDCILYADAPDMGVYGGGEWSEKKGEFEIMQYTGLKDRNGKEIYEWDIVKAFDSGRHFDPENYDIYKVHWSEFGWMPFVAKGCNWASYFGEIKEFEVIGNIYENPELTEHE